MEEQRMVSPETTFHLRVVGACLAFVLTIAAVRFAAAVASAAMAKVDWSPMESPDITDAFELGPKNLLSTRQAVHRRAGPPVGEIRMGFRRSIVAESKEFRLRFGPIHAVLKSADGATIARCRRTPWVWTIDHGSTKYTLRRAMGDAPLFIDARYGFGTALIDSGRRVVGFLGARESGLPRTMPLHVQLFVIVVVAYDASGSEPPGEGD
jgi:hypothetical protein